VTEEFAVCASHITKGRKDCAIANIENLIIMLSMPPPDLSGTRETKEIKQIATLASGEIVALCNDSTVWIYAGSGWQKLPDLAEATDR
jgi:hypothetical protein